MCLHRLKIMALPPEDRRILLASVIELQECINETYGRHGANSLFMDLVGLIDERVTKLNDEDSYPRYGDSGTATPDF
jgi:hypothetical protein